MTNRNLRNRFAIAVLGAILFAGCFTTEDRQDNTSPVVLKPTDKDTNKTDSLNPIVVTKPDSQLVPLTGGPGKNNGWDDFPNKFLPTLQVFAGKMTKLPLPYGVRYNIVVDKPLSKTAAADSCPDGPREIFGLNVPATGLYVVDTIRYYNMQGEVGCNWHTLNTSRVTHDRYVMDLGSGEAWEHIEDSVSEQVVLPRYAIGGSGRIKLNSKIEFKIDSYRVDMVTPYGEPGAIVTGGHLRMTWKDGYWFDLEVVKATPFKVDDFFPVRGTPTAGEKVMSGPIRHDTTTVGYMDLFADHSVVIRDWAGKLVETPK